MRWRYSSLDCFLDLASASPIGEFVGTVSSRIHILFSVSMATISGWRDVYITFGGTVAGGFLSALFPSRSV